MTQTDWIAEAEAAHAEVCRRLSKDVSLRRKLIGVEYEKRYLAAKKGWAHRRSADRAFVNGASCSTESPPSRASIPCAGEA